MREPASLAPASDDSFCHSLFASAPVEFKLLAACCAWPDSAEREACITRALALSPDWEQVLQLAARHRVNGLVHAALDGREIVPEAFRRTLAQRAARTRQSNLLSLAMASRVTQALAGENIAAVVLKGMPVGQLAFGDAALRHNKDIDLLLSEDQALRAEDVLHDLGFERLEPAASLNAVQSKRWMRFRKHFEYIHAATGTLLEVHWRPFDNSRLMQMDLTETQQVAVGSSISLPAPTLPELLLYLCAHGASHAWFRLKWIADVAALLRSEAAPSPAELLALARKRGIARPVEEALLLCDALFATAYFPASAAVSRSVRWLSLAARDALLTSSTTSASVETDFVPLRQGRSRLLLRREWRYRLEEARVFSAAPADWQLLPLPASLGWSYPLLRLPLWIKRHAFSNASNQPAGKPVALAPVALAVAGKENGAAA